MFLYSSLLSSTALWNLAALASLKAQLRSHGLHSGSPTGAPAWKLSLRGKKGPSTGPLPSLPAGHATIVPKYQYRDYPCPQGQCLPSAHFLVVLGTTRLKNISVTMEFLQQFLNSESLSRLLWVTNLKHFPGRGDGTGLQQGILGVARNITCQLLVEYGIA